MYREVGIVDPTSTLNHDQFVSLINAIDSGLRALPATAQVCMLCVGVSVGRACLGCMHGDSAHLAIGRRGCSAWGAHH